MLHLTFDFEGLFESSTFIYALIDTAIYGTIQLSVN